MADKTFTLEEVQQLLATRNGTPPPAPIAVSPYGMGAVMPAAAMQPAYQPQFSGALPVQPSGVAIPITVGLPDGREVPVQLLFGAEHAANVQALVAMLANVLGPALKAYPPRNPYGNGGGGYGGNNGYRGGYRGGRRY